MLGQANTDYLPNKKVMFYLFLIIILVNIYVFIRMEMDYYNSREVFMMIFLGMPFMLGFMLSLPYVLVMIALELFKLYKKIKFDFRPFLLLSLQILYILMWLFWRTIFPIPDYYQPHLRDLEGLVPVVQEQISRHDIDKGPIEIVVPKRLKGIADRRIDAIMDNGVLKIKVLLTGAAVGGHTFLLYRSDGKYPDEKDVFSSLISTEHITTYRRKSHNWFFVDWND